MNARISLNEKQSALLVIHMLIGAGLALLLIFIFLWGVKPDPGWPSFWKIKPLLIVPLAGAMGGGWFYFMKHRMITNKALAIFIGILGYVIILWMGTVLGLEGTMWD